MSSKTRSRMNNENSTPSTKSKEKMDISNNEANGQKETEIIVSKKDLLYLQHMLNELQDYKKMFNEKINFIDDCKYFLNFSYKCKFSEQNK